MKFLLFGTGDYYERYKKWFAKEDVLALLDNSVNKQHTILDGIPVLPPEEGMVLPYDAVVILSFYVKEMREQLHRLGVPDEKIYHFYDLHRLLSGKKQELQYYGDFKAGVTGISEDSRQRRILLMSHDLEFGGPSLALYQAGKTLTENGYSVVFASMIDGPLKEILLEKGIPVVVDANLQIGTMAELEWIRGFDLLICNTINYHVFLSGRDSGIPVIWWLHDSAFFYHGVRKEVLQAIDRTNLTVCSVGSVPEKAMHEFLPELFIENLFYGVEDTCRSSAERQAQETMADDGKLHFVTIGYIENRKGQDILVEAIRLLPQEIREKAEFCFVGQNTSAMAKKIIEQAKEIPELFITGAVNRERINEMLNRADVLICPSREDPMPTVCAEAMMHGVPCLVSDAVGTADYIENNVNGFVFPSKNIQSLSDKIAWCVQNNKRLAVIGKNARKLYEQKFSLEASEEKILELVGRFI